MSRAASPTWVPAQHGYIAYTNGCRCEVCRKAKADYMRARRAAARALAAKHTRSSTGARGARHNAFAPGAFRYLARNVLHGTRAAYDEHGCRCRECVDRAHEWKRGAK